MNNYELNQKVKGGGFNNNGEKTFVGYKLIFNHSINYDCHNAPELMMKTGLIINMSKTIEFRGESDKSKIQRIASAFNDTDKPVIVEWFE